MIREKGGRRQPRYYYLKDKAAGDICKYLEYSSPIRVLNKEVEAERTFDELVFEIYFRIWAKI